MHWSILHAVQQNPTFIGPNCLIRPLIRCAKLLLSSPHRLDPPVLLADPLRRLPAVLDLRRVAHRLQGDLPRLPLHHRVARGEVRRERRLDCTKEWKRFLKFMVSRKKRGNLFMRRTVIRGGREKKFLLPFCERERERGGRKFSWEKEGSAQINFLFFPLCFPASWLGVDFGVCLLFPSHSTRPERKPHQRRVFFCGGAKEEKSVKWVVRMGCREEKGIRSWPPLFLAKGGEGGKQQIFSPYSLLAPGTSADSGGNCCFFCLLGGCQTISKTRLTQDDEVDLCRPGVRLLDGGVVRGALERAPVVLGAGPGGNKK